MIKRPLRAMLLIPTGVGAAIGGYAGDALPVARAIAAVVDHLITHPNVLNGASLYWQMPNVHYVEGFALDQFALGNWGLRPVHQNRIGVIFDCGIEPELYGRQLQAIAAAKATLGIDITETIQTDRALGVTLKTGNSGATWGTIAQPDSLLRAAETLIKTKKVDAIAVIARFADELTAALQNYRQGQGVDALAGAEAVISHLISREFAIPTAHAPALSPLPLDLTISDRACAEEIGYTFLPCVLVGLSRAPRLVQSNFQANDLTVNDLDLAISPQSACGGAGLLAIAARNIPLILVEQNTTTLKVLPSDLRLESMTKVIKVKNYLEAIGIIAAFKAGINPQTLALNNITN
jgi:Protein of unknown function (DUF3326)